MNEEETALSKPFSNAKHIGQLGDLLILLTLRRLGWKADGLDVAEHLKDFRIKVGYGYIRRRHHEKPELYGRKSGQLEVTDPEVRQQVEFLLRVIRVLPFPKKNPPYPMCIRDDVGNYFAWTPSSFGMQAATEEERDAELERRKAATADRGRHKKDVASPLFD